METKLTLRLKKHVIDSAKKYANDHDTSLSKLVENYLEAVTKDQVNEMAISPLVRSLSGVIEMPISDNLEAGYHKHIKEKYL